MTDTISGNGISNMCKISEALRAMKAVGFELEFHEDLATRPDAVPWYYPLSGEWKHARSLYDLFTVLRLVLIFSLVSWTKTKLLFYRITKLGQTVVHGFVGVMESLGLAPRGTQKTADNLSVAAEGLVEGAQVCTGHSTLLTIANRNKI